MTCQQRDAVQSLQAMKAESQQAAVKNLKELSQPGVRLLLQLLKEEVGSRASMAAEETCPRWRQASCRGRTLLCPGWKQLLGAPGPGRVLKETTQLFRMESKAGKNLIHLTTPKI